jgi:lipoyl synthase
MTEQAENRTTVPQARRRFPAWLKKPLILKGGYQTVASCVERLHLHTVCVEAGCPNRSECFSSGTATFLIMGNHCTRSCGFCGVRHGTPLPLDRGEPAAIAHAARELNLRHIVVTSVTRDDLVDGGAAHFAETVRQCKAALADATVEILVPDFRGNHDALDTVIAAAPDILNHNLETVPRLYGTVRPQADYRRSLALLAYAHAKNTKTKSGIMVGLGENEEEVVSVLKDLRTAGCAIITIGQYLQPSADRVPVVRYEPPERFAYYEQTAKALGFAAVFSGPFVRSSYKAHRAVKTTAGQP